MKVKHHINLKSNNVKIEMYNKLKNISYTYKCIKNIE